MKEMTKEDLTKLKNAYRNMLRRCYNENCIAYKYYGARNITICERWLESFENFAKDMYNDTYNIDLSIDRIDSNGNYEPENVRWATATTQNRNRTNSTIVKYQGEERNLAELCEMFNQNTSLVWKRVFRYNWSLERALRTDAKPRKLKEKA